MSPVCESNICCLSLLCYSALRWTSLVLAQLRQKALAWIISVRSSLIGLGLTHITYILTISLIQTQCLNCMCDWSIFNHLIHLGSKLHHINEHKDVDYTGAYVELCEVAKYCEYGISLTFCFLLQMIGMSCDGYL